MTTENASPVLSEPIATHYGLVRRIRYLVSSTPEFLDIISTVNLILGRAETREDVELLQKSTTFVATPLPDFLSKFIASFDVPSELLGETRTAHSIRLEWSDYQQPKDKFKLVRRTPDVAFSCDVNSLFDINLALYHFEATLASAIPPAQWARIKRTIRIQATSKPGPVASNELLIAVEANPAKPL